jgi:hypothetical protein
MSSKHPMPHRGFNLPELLEACQSARPQTDIEAKIRLWLDHAKHYPEAQTSVAFDDFLSLVQHTMMPELWVFKNGSKVAAIGWSQEENRLEESNVCYLNVTPGNFLIKFSNGRELWREHLSAADLLISGSQNSNLKLAADTGNSSGEREISLFHSLMLLRIKPGREKGVLEIQI